VKLIVGLGNPGPRYRATRHNLGAEVVERAAQALGLALTHTTCRAQWGRSRGEGRKALLALPSTYMNGSGQAVAALARYHKISPTDILVVSDDLHLAPGRLRLRRGGSAGGHNGLQSVIDTLGSDVFHRLRVGIGAPGPGGDQVEYVLGRFTAGEQEARRNAVEHGAEAALCWLEEGIDAAMRRFNA
jgi:PTH1 family peptidyl-tRNA hydrolase